MFRSYLLIPSQISTGQFYIFLGTVNMRVSFFSLGLLASLASFAFGEDAIEKRGRTVHFSLKLTWEKGAPDGFEREMIFMNGQFPGPTLNIVEGDDVEFAVTNNLPFGTTIHFHGIEYAKTFPV